MKGNVSGDEFVRTISKFRYHVAALQWHQRNVQKECAVLADFVCLFFVLFAYLAYSFFDVFIAVAVVGS